jgi:hypothetical protein
MTTLRKPGPDPKPEPRQKKSPKRIRPVAVKRAEQNKEYTAKSREWLKGKKCAVKKDVPAECVHHMAGREGYADKWARDNGVTLLLDERYWLPVSMDAHTAIENNPEWAKENGYSVNRTNL